MNSKKIAAAALAMMMAAGTVASFTGCSKDSGNDSSTTNSTTHEAKNNSDEYTKVDGKGATLTVYTNRTDRIDDGTYAKLTKAFEEENNCKVEYKGLTDYEGDISKKMTTDDYGDVLLLPGTVTTGNMADYLEPLGKYDELSKVYRWADQKMTDDGTVYGLATGGSVTGLLYNKTVWKNAGYSEEEGNLPKTPDDFKKALKAVKEKNDKIYPLLTDFGDSWVVGKWNDWVLSASGDPAYNQKLLDEKTDIFAEDSYYYQVYKLMFDVFSDKTLREDNPSATNMWENSKTMLPKGQVGCMVLGSWAVSQFQEAAEKCGAGKDVVGFMPVPFTAPDGKQYTQTNPDYFMGVSSKSKNKELAKSFVEWFIKNSGYPESEGMLSTVIANPLPDIISGWKDKVEFFDEAKAKDGYTGVFKEINNASINTDNNDAGNFKIDMAQAAFDGKGEAEFKKIVDKANKSWAEARDKILKEKGLDK